MSSGNRRMWPMRRMRPTRPATARRGGGSGARARSRRGPAAVTGLALLAGALLAPSAAGAAPDAPGAPRECPEGLLDRYEPGDDVTVIGYTAGCVGEASGPGTSGTPADPRVISGYLHAEPCASVDLPYCAELRGHVDPASGTPLGRFTLAPASDPARGQRMELTFQLPAGMASGLYYLLVCADPCAADASGELATPLYVGVDPPPGERPVRHWPLDDPAIADLPDDALVRPGNGRTMTAAEARAAVAGTAGTGESGGTDTVTEAPDGGTGSWRPPGWSLALVLVVALAAVATWRRTGGAGGRKHVRRPDRDHLDRTGTT